MLYLRLAEATVSFFLGCVNLCNVPFCRDLDVIITSDLSPSVYIRDIVAKAHQRSNAIHRCFLSRNVSLLTQAFLVYVHPLVEYNYTVWSPHLKQDPLQKVRNPYPFPSVHWAPFDTASWVETFPNKKHLKNVVPIHHCEPPHANSPDVASGTVARRLRIDVHDATDNDDNDNA